MNQPDLFGLNSIINKPRLHDGKFAPVKKYPQQSVKRHLESGLEITVSICYRLHFTHDLRKIITRLKRSGMNIEGKMYRDKMNCYKVYKLKKDG